MLSTIRVTLAVIVGAFALWSQTIAANGSTLSDASLPASGQLAFRLDLPQSGTDSLVSASNSTPDLGGQTASSQPPSPTMAIWSGRRSAMRQHRELAAVGF